MSLLHVSRPVDSVVLSRVALGAIAALLTESAFAAPLPQIVYPAGAGGAALSRSSPLADVSAPAGTGQRVVISGGAQTDYFGWSVAMDGDTALVGAGSYNMTRAGAAYAFARTANVFEETHAYAGDGGGVDDYGWSVAVSGTDAIVGEPFANVDGSFAQGAVFFYALGAPTDDAIFANGFE